jgi:hypothetical protein
MRTIKPFVVDEGAKREPRQRDETLRRGRPVLRRAGQALLGVDGREQLAVRGVVDDKSFDERDVLRWRFGVSKLAGGTVEGAVAFGCRLMRVHRMRRGEQQKEE